MQLKRPPGKHPPGMDARRRLMAASCALLGVGVSRGEQPTPAPPDSGLFQDWAVDSAVAYYHEDGRVQAVEPLVDVSKEFADGESLDLHATFDSLSGSSPNGALTSRTPQTFASPSGTNLSAGKHTYVTSPGALPVDPHYHDQRVAAEVDWTLPLTRIDQVTLGAKLSGEDDFYSATVSASIAHDLNEKNTTLSLGLSNEYDSIHPIGGTPAPGSDYQLFEKVGAQSKNGVGAVLGITQVMTRRWLAEWNVSLDRFAGYLNDPYKITSVIDAAGNTDGYRFESRPDQRLRKSIFWDNRVAFSEPFTTALSIRYMADDWGVRSKTVELRPRWTFDDCAYVEPVLRWYRQTGTNFYVPFLLNAAKPASEYESSDTRLAPFRAVTVGLKYAHGLPGVAGRSRSEFNVRAEYYQQTLDVRTPVPSALDGLDLYPDLKAVLVQVGWSF